VEKSKLSTYSFFANALSKQKELLNEIEIWKTLEMVITNNI
jgi:hypothetical protein